MTSLDSDGFTVNALGGQAESARRTAPQYSLSKVGRDNLQGVYISEDHTRTSRIGRESPIGGPIYKQDSTLGGLSYSFGGGRKDVSSPTRPKNNDMSSKGDDPLDYPTNDALGCWVDSQPFKYKREPKHIIGTEPRGKLKDAALLENHSVAFYGRQSPGPAAAPGDKFGRPNTELTKARFAPARPFGTRTPIKWMEIGQNPADVGPGRHERKDNSLGTQHRSSRRTQSVHEFSHGPKFPKQRDADSISVLDNARSCMGKQVLNKNKSSPAINFSADNRDTRSKTMLCMTRADAGPRANMAKFTAPMPRLPAESAIRSAGIG